MPPADARLAAVWASLSHEHQRLGYMSVSIYDTAWVACVKQPAGHWAFPSSFQFILDTQSPDGLWTAQLRSSSDLLNSLGGLFALAKHAHDPDSSGGIQSRISTAKQSIQSALRTWQLDNGDSVAFEVLIPAMLDLLESEDLHFDFPNRQALWDLRQEKLVRLDRDAVYTHGSTLLHSAEAFYADDTFDFNRLAVHKIRGSIMASPSASAAYLMRCSSWDLETEAYLHDVLANGSGSSSGGVPSAYPSNIFEWTWSLNTLLTAAYDLPPSVQPVHDRMISILSSTAKDQGGCVGFAPGIQPDLDDTAQASVTLNLLDRKGLTVSMAANFETVDHFKTYALERNPSFSAHCSAMQALLQDKEQWNHDLPLWMSKIKKALDFILSRCWVAEKFPTDKWNISPWYSMLMMTKALVKLVVALDNLDTEDLTSTVSLHDFERIVLALNQCLTRTCICQAADGSWGEAGPEEETSYAILSLSALHQLELFAGFRNTIRTAVEQGRRFLKSSAGLSQPEKLWIEKVNFGSQLLSDSYVWAALNTPLAIEPEGNKSKKYSSLLIERFTGLKTSVHFFQKLPLLRTCPDWLVLSSGMESSFFSPMLHKLRSTVFVREGFSEDKYLSWIPLIWILANNHRRAFQSNEFIFDMMAISMINFQADEFMEAVVGECSASDLQLVAKFIQGPLLEPRAEHTQLNGSAGNHAGTETTHDGHETVQPSTLSTAEEIKHDLPKVFGGLRNLVDYVTKHEIIRNASSRDQEVLRNQLRIFLQAHLQQVRDNSDLQRMQLKRRVDGVAAPAVLSRTFDEFKGWLRTTASAHTSCAYSFAFASCLRAAPGRDFLPSTEAKYIADDVVQHLATMCRIFNDQGSIARDRKEVNLNCVNFAQVAYEAARPDGTLDDAAAKQKLATLAAYERRMLDKALKELMQVSDSRVKGMLEIFVAVTDIFGEIYILRDLASQRQA